MEPYITGHKASGIHVGDWVRVTRRAYTHEQGWDNSWITDPMTSTIGRIGRVSADNDEGGFVVNFFSDVDYGYPFFVLTKIDIRESFSYEYSLLEELREILNLEKGAFISGARKIRERLLYLEEVANKYEAIKDHIRDINDVLDL